MKLSSQREKFRREKQDLTTKNHVKFLNWNQTNYTVAQSSSHTSKIGKMLPLLKNTNIRPKLEVSKTKDVASATNRSVWKTKYIFMFNETLPLLKKLLLFPFLLQYQRNPQ